MTPPLSRDAFVAELREEGTRRYHDRHPFHVRMHEGGLTEEQLRGWVLNRWCYQARIPVKDAIILSKSREPAFRRRWIQRIHDHDGEDGGLALWTRLARALDIDEDELVSERQVLPGVRFACDAYVTLVQQVSLVEAVASSLTEFFAPDLLTRRLEAWERHYPFVDGAALEYFRQRVPRATRDATHAIEFVVAGAHTRELQERCVEALVRKTEILWHLLDCVAAAYGPAPCR